MQSIQKSCNPLQQSFIVERGLDLRHRAKCAKEYMRRGCAYMALLAIILYDIANKCPYSNSKWYYLEFVAAVVLTLSVLHCFIKYFLYLFYTDPVQGTKPQKDLLQFDDYDNSFITTPSTSAAKKATEEEITGLNNTILSWHSSFNDSRCQTSPMWNYSRMTPPRQSLSPHHQLIQNMSWNSSGMLIDSLYNTAMLNNNAPFISPYYKYSAKDLISDEPSLKEYLYEFSKKEYSMNETADITHSFNSGPINSFWNYCNTTANMLKTSVYQLAPSTIPSTPNKQSTNEEGGINIMDSNSEVIKRISSERLSQYVGNLRGWISATILQRLAKEILKVDESFKTRGFADMQIGNIGLERLKKTVENQQFVNQYMPKLPLIVPFLEMSSNQEYLVQRIKDLSKGSCIADYRWNSGSSYHGLKWDEHLPTDSAILFHLFCVYLDSQLMPLPQGGGRPFYSRYVIIGEEKRSVKDTITLVQNRAHCAILCTNPLKPKFNFISDKEIHNCAYDRNNLFYVIIQFLIYMKTHQDSSLEGVNLGGSGINIMCVIED